MNFSPQDVENLFLDLQSAIRAEKSTKKVRKIDPSLFVTVPELIRFLQDEAEKSAATDIDRYIQIKERLRQIERAFKSLFQIRYSKIVRIPVFDNKSDEIGNLSEEEREFIDVIYSRVKEQFNQLLGIKTVEAKEKAIVLNSDEKKDSTMRSNQDDYVMVRIVGDQPRIAQADRNYHFRDGDVVFIRGALAELLMKRKIAVPVNFNLPGQQKRNNA